MNIQNLVGSGVTSLIGLVVGVLVIIVVLGVAGLLVVLVVSNRADPDPTGRRPFVVYLFGIAFITVWTALLSSSAIVRSLVNLIGSHQNAFGVGSHPIGDATWRSVVLGGLILIVSLITLGIHLHRGVALADGQDQPLSPAGRVLQSYVSGVAFISVLLIIVSIVSVLYNLFQIAAPGVFGGAGRIPLLRHLLDTAYIGLAAVGILMFHLKMAKPHLWSWPSRTATSAAPSAAEVN